MTLLPLFKKVMDGPTVEEIKEIIHENTMEKWIYLGKGPCNGYNPGMCQKFICPNKSEGAHIQWAKIRKSLPTAILTTKKSFDNRLVILVPVTQ